MMNNNDLEYTDWLENTYSMTQPNADPDKEYAMLIKRRDEILFNIECTTDMFDEELAEIKQINEKLEEMI